MPIMDAEPHLTYIDAIEVPHLPQDCTSVATLLVHPWGPYMILSTWTYSRRASVRIL
jgi:hypothetical protein